MKNETEILSDEFCKKVIGKSLDELTDEVMTYSGQTADSSGLSPEEYRAFTKLNCAFTVAMLARGGMGLEFDPIPDSPDMPKAKIACFDFDYHANDKDGQ